MLSEAPQGLCGSELRAVIFTWRCAKLSISAAGFPAPGGAAVRAGNQSAARDAGTPEGGGATSPCNFFLKSRSC